MKLNLCDSFFYRITNREIDIFKEFNTNKDNVLRNNKEIGFYNGEWVKVKINDYITHHTKPMETLNSISLFYNTTVEKIMQDNALKSEKLFIGQTLKIFK